MTESQIDSFHLPVEIHHHWHFSFFQNNANRVILFASECDFYNYRQSHSVIFEFWLKDGTLSHCLEKENRWKNSKMKQKWTKHMFENWEYYSHINNWLVELDDNRYRLCDCQSLSYILETNGSSKSWETIISNIRWSLWAKDVTFDNVLFNQQVEESVQETNNQWNNRELTTLMNEIDSFELLRMEKIFKCNWSGLIGWFRENNKNLLLSWKTSKIEEKHV